MSAPHRHGGEVYSLAKALGVQPDMLLDFSSNANIFAHDLTEALVRSTPYPFLHYPDTQSTSLVRAIAEHEQVEPDRILAGNGAAELIWLVMQGFAPRLVLFVGPVFSEHITACEALSIPYEILTPSPARDFDLSSEDLARLWESSADLVVLCTPNNPAGITYPNMRAVFQVLRAPRVLIDNSYREFLYPTEEYNENHLNAYSAAARPGVAVFTLHSFTKFFCCPGIRLGYLMGDRNHLARLISRRPSWTISPFAQVMGQEFLRSIEDYRERLEPLHAAQTEMGRELRRLDCLDPDRVFDGPGFFCCGLTSGRTAQGVFSALLKQHIVVRGCDNIPGMPPGYIRVQARPAEDTERLLRALDRL